MQSSGPFIFSSHLIREVLCFSSFSFLLLPALWGGAGPGLVDDYGGGPGWGPDGLRPTAYGPPAVSRVRRTVCWGAPEGPCPADYGLGAARCLTCPADCLLGRAWGGVAGGLRLRGRPLPFVSGGLAVGERLGGHVRRTTG